MRRGFEWVAMVVLLGGVACGADDSQGGGSSDSGAGDGTTRDSSSPDAANDSAHDATNDTASDTSSPDSGADSSSADSSADAPSDGPARDGAPLTKDVSVGQGGLTFSPQNLTIVAGDTVRWTWASSGHTVTSGTGGVADNKFCSPTDTSCATAPTTNSGGTYSHTFTTAGSFPYFCRPHAGAGMTGTITVQ